MSDESRSLTLREEALAKAVFKSSIDYKKVRIHDKKYFPLQPRDVGMTPNGEIYVSGDLLYSSDYGVDSHYHKSFFIHEMAHVYQYQLKILNPIASAIGEYLTNGFNYLKAYEYTLEVGKDLLEYSLEQQAQIISDYFLLYILRGKLEINTLRNELDLVRKDKLYHKVLANFLADPNYARHKIDCRHMHKNRRTPCRRVLIK